MISPTFNAETTRLVKALHATQEKIRSAIRRDDIPAANRNLMSAWRTLGKLAATGPRGRDALEELLKSPLPDIRLRAAEAIIDWAPELAIPVFGRLACEDLGDLSADERLDIRISAKHMLFKIFNIKTYDHNDLIEPLKAYGVDLPYRDHAKWQNNPIPTYPMRKTGVGEKS